MSEEKMKDINDTAMENESGKKARKASAEKMFEMIGEADEKFLREADEIKGENAPESGKRRSSLVRAVMSASPIRISKRWLRRCTARDTGWNGQMT